MMHILFFMTLLLTGAADPAASYRHLLIFGEKEHPALLKEQLQQLDRSAAGVRERDIRIRIIEPGNSLYEKHKVRPSQFAVILIGKDGGEKYRTNKLLPAEDLFALIDAMPMRKAEMAKDRGRL